MYMAGAWFAGTLTTSSRRSTASGRPRRFRTATAGCKTTIAGDSLVMFDDARHQDAAWLWMEYLSQPDILADWTYKTEGTLLPPLNSLLEGDEIVKEKPVLRALST